ncbi:MAG: hypothetical protein PHZ07_04405 [Patescibacteria group bacterium]|nr:hypothetical protein [Patescibacteria group bacterium]MDD4303989.1 hypothetical protein [Patescibacteria group bacterium]MDD4695022.1 hypothetical protein [Patescibacteria group bacterium]
MMVQITDQVFKQKSIENYLSELNVPEQKREKALMSITDMVYGRNQRIIEIEKEVDEEKREEIAKIINEKDYLIKQKLEQIIDGVEEDISYDY